MYVKDVEDGKRTYTQICAHNFLNIQLIFNMEKFWKEHVEDVKDRSSTLKGSNAMYVEDIKDGVCSLYATLHTELLILLLMSKVLKM